MVKLLLNVTSNSLLQLAVIEGILSQAYTYRD